MRKEKVEVEALAFLDATEDELTKVVSVACTEIVAAEKLSAEHAAALQNHATTGTGLLKAIAARGWLDSFDRFVFGDLRPLGATTHEQRENFFQSQKAQTEKIARDAFLREHSAEIAKVLRKLIEIRSVGREAWRSSIADEVASLDRGLLLGTTPESETGNITNRLTQLENNLAGADAQFYEAARLTERLASNFNTDNIIEVYSDAARFVSSLPSYEK